MSISDGMISYNDSESRMKRYPAMIVNSDDQIHGKDTESVMTRYSAIIVNQ